MNRARYISFALAITGLLVSLYLTWVKVTDNRAACVQGLGDCWTVNTSAYSEIYGIPVALLGAFAYSIIIALIYLETRFHFFNVNATLILFGITLAGSLYSLYLTYLELFVIKAVCPFCVISALMMISLFIFTSVRLNNEPIRTLN